MKAVVLLCILLVLASVGVAWSAVFFSESFEGATVGSVPSPWSLAGPVSGTTGKVVAGYSGNQTKVFQFTDTNTNSLSNTLFASFPGTTVGLCVLQCDVCFANTHAGFGARITNGLMATSSQNWGAAVKFEGDAPYATSATSGTLSYQQYGALTTTDSYLAVTPAVHFQANTWYTVRIEANMDTKRYSLYFGPCGGSIDLITPSAGVPFIKNTNGGQISTAAGLSFFTSQKVEPAGEMYMDNVVVTNGAEYWGTVAEAKKRSSGTLVELADKTVSAGADQMNKGFFYIQDETGGVRVRSSQTVRQGDKVTVVGTMQRASDNGTLVMRNGEREINAKSLSVTYGPFPMPKVVGMTNRSIGGGPWGPLDSDGYPCQPGVWAQSSGAPSGYDQISEQGLNNVGRLGRFFGRVTYVDSANRFFYINDGSDVQDGAAVAGSPSPRGVRVLAPPEAPLTNILGKYAVITGVVGSVSQADAGGGSYVRNVRVIRATCEPFLDLNSNGFRDAGEAYVDLNGSHGYDGIDVGTVPAPNYNSVFDRYGTAIYRQRPFMPKAIYVYWPDTPTLDEMVRQGFNTIVCFELVPGHLADINAHGLKTLPCLRVVESRPGWLAVKNDPAILGWYLADEPEGHGYTPEMALTDFNWLKGQDPSHFVGESHFIYEAYANYAASDEFALSDRYPIGNAPLCQVGDFISMTKGIHGSEYYPAWPFIQTFQESPNFVMPSPEQVRAMTYQALAHHAKGLFYFSYQRPDHPYWPLNWAEIKRINGEMEMLSPFLLMPWVPVDVTSTNGNVRVGGFRVGGSAVIFTVNVEGTNQATTITLPGIGSDSLSLPLEGGATQPLTNRGFTYTYAPYQVRVLMWGDIPPAP